MADPNDTSTPDPARNQSEQTPTSSASLTSSAKASAMTQDPNAAETVSYSPAPASLKARIDAEREQLMRAHAVIKSLSSALLNLDDVESTSYVDTADFVAELINQSVTRLETIASPTYKRVDSKPLSVKEPRVVIVAEDRIWT